VEPSGLHLIPVRDLSDDPRLAPYANLKDQQLAAIHDGVPGADPAGFFMAEGRTVIEILLQSRFQVHSLLVASSRVEALAPMLAGAAPGTPIFTAEQAVMNAIVGFDIHRGALACGIRRPNADTAAIARLASSAIVLEDLTNADNVGAVFRNAAALGGRAPAVFLSPRSCDPLYRKALRVSMGHALRVPFATLTPWPASLRVLSDAGFETIALTPDSAATDVQDLRLAPGKRPALLLGTEGPGLSLETMSIATHRARIAMNVGVDSLNVAVAAAVALHHLAATNDLQT
jgi:tRNA G18 (ribose-2'-O)-methylase SpoU